jgi:hypothetical protein
MLDCNRRVLGVGDQLPGGSGLAAQSFEYVKMIGTGTDDARGRAFRERGHECERLVESGWWVEDSGVGYHADEAGQNEDREGERLRSCRQTGDPGRILGVIGNGVFDVRVYQDVYVGKQHLESPAPMPEPGLVILRIEPPGPVEVDSGAGMNATYRHQPEWRRLRRLATLQSIIQRFGDKGADADATGFGCAAHLFGKLVVKGNCCSHDAKA